MRISARDKLKFARAKVLSARGDAQAVLEIMQDLAESNPHSGSIRQILAGAYQDCGNLKLAETEFQEAIGLNPRSELASLGLFHILWDSGRKDEAFEEMKRFMPISDSKDYREIVEEINRADD